jgi:ligand-binding sensor protein
VESTGTSSFQLDKLIDLELLQRVQDHLAAAFGLSSMVMAPDGGELTPISEWRPYCDAVCQIPAGLKRCRDSWRKGADRAAREGRPTAYFCYGGLADLASPVIYKGEHMATLLCGLVRLEGREKSHEEESAHELERLPLASQEMAELHSQIPVMRPDQLSHAANIVFDMAQYVVSVAAKGQLERALAEAELLALQGQVQPHFLYNTLNAISALALFEEAPRTVEAIHTLAALLRHSLGKKAETRLKAEVAHAGGYLALQKLRLGDRLRYSIDVSPGLEAVALPVLTLQPLVENAVVHGIEPRRAGGSITLRARADGGAAVIEVIDDGVGLARSPQGATGAVITHRSSAGIGLDNLRERLRYLYGARGQLELEPGAHGGVTARLRLPL